MIDYWQLFGIDTIAVLIWISTLVFAWYCQAHSNWGISKAAVFFFIASWIFSAGFVYLAYSGTVEAHAEAYLYKVSVENGIENGDKRDYYEQAEEGKAKIQDEISKANLDLGQLGVKYNYGDAGRDNRYFALFWDSMANMSFAPIWIWGLLGLCAYPYMGYIDHKLNKDVEDRSQMLCAINKDIGTDKQKLQEIRVEYVNIKSDLSQKQNEIGQVKTELNMLKSSLNNLKSTPEYQEYQKLKNDLLLLDGTFKNKKSDYDSLEAEYNMRKRSNDLLKTENQKLREENQSLTQENVEKKKAQTKADEKFLQEMQNLLDDDDQ